MNGMNESSNHNGQRDEREWQGYVRHNLDQLIFTNADNYEFASFYQQASQDIGFSTLAAFGTRHILERFVTNRKSFDGEFLQRRMPIIAEGIGRSVEDQLLFVRNIAILFLNTHVSLSDCDRFIQMLVQHQAITKFVSTHWFVPKGKAGDSDSDVITKRYESITNCLSLRQRIGKIRKFFKGLIESLSPQKGRQ